MVYSKAVFFLNKAGEHTQGKIYFRSKRKFHFYFSQTLKIMVYYHLPFK